MSILTLGPNGGAKVYSSTRAASRALSGTGSEDALRSSISRRCQKGGGWLGKVWVQATTFPGIRRP